ncbi:MAG TPA: GNAT family N-acetyltransferase [Candidatus Thermoplasmatota archaeon]|nr:GNAT family N-acetyltransferase [Candidatus Thermoplasmatota archaeon]
MQAEHGRSVETAAALLAVRPMRPEEAGLVARYFHAASDADLERMGVVERARLPPEKDWTRQLDAALRQAPETAGSAYFAWVVDGLPVGFSSLKNLRPGEGADLHLHMWSAAHRGQGHGAILFCLTVQEAFERFRLRQAFCEPKATNPMPNRLLTKVGFPLIATYVGASSELSRTTQLNRYDIRSEVADAYLRKVQAHRSAPRHSPAPESI